MPRATPLLVSLLVAAGAATGCGEGRMAHPDTLEPIVQRIIGARLDGEPADVERLVLSLCPSTDELEAVLNGSPQAQAFLRSSTFLDLRRDDDDRLGPVCRWLFDANRIEQTEVHLHEATTEELRAWRRGTVAFQKFPQEMRRFARTVAAPGVRWFLVELTEPGESIGAEFGVFARLDNRFVLLPQPWNLLGAP